MVERRSATGLLVNSPAPTARERAALHRLHREADRDANSEQALIEMLLTASGVLSLRRPFLLRLIKRPVATRNSSNGTSSDALLLVWVNLRTTAPLVCEHVDGGGVYTIRHLLHAAISLDGGDSWLGHREIYRDPLMQTQPPPRGDIGVAYSYGQELASGEVLLRTGQGIGRTQVGKILLGCGARNNIHH